MEGFLEKEPGEGRDGETGEENRKAAVELTAGRTEVKNTEMSVPAGEEPEETERERGKEAKGETVMGLGQASESEREGQSGEKEKKEE